MSEKAVCGLCGEPMPAGEEMFKFHGYSGPCPKPPLPKPTPPEDRREPVERALKEWLERSKLEYLSIAELAFRAGYAAGRAAGKEGSG